MAKCYQCGKKFQWKRFDGICPKCGAYNHPETAAGQQKTPQPSQAYSSADSQRVPSAYGERVQPAYSGRTQAAYGRGEQSAADRKSRHILFGLIVGIAAATIVPYLVMLAVTAGWKAVEANSRADGKTVLPEVVSAEQGTPLPVEPSGEVTVTVEHAEIVAKADTFSDFPAGEKLVGVYLSADIPEDARWDDYHGTYYLIGEPYIACRGNYKTAVDEYELEETHAELLGENTTFTRYGVSYGDDGYLYFFVPKEDTQLELYIDVRDRETDEVQKIYRVSVELGMEGET